MDAAKFLRALADLISAAQDSPATDEEKVQSDKTDVMVPPLQQEIELMKKATNVDSVFDKTAEVETESSTEPVEIGSNDTENELTILKKNAGLGLGLTDDVARG